MTQPPVPGRDAGDEPVRGPGLPGGGPVPVLPLGGRDSRLGSFATGDVGDRFPPSGWLAMIVDELSGPDRRCPAATDDELIGIMGRWQAVQSWAGAGKLGVIAELIRRRALPGHEDRAPGGLPTRWEQGLEHEVSAALGLSLPGADKVTVLAWTLQARLPRIGALLHAGIIDDLKAKIIADELAVLDDERAAQAEALIAGELAGKTPGQIGKLAASAAVDVDPAGAQRRRETAERETARIQFWRESTGTSALAGYGLPTDAALAANANINRRAKAYKRAKLDGGMDQLRVLAYLDILNGIAAHTRIAQARAEAAARATQAAQESQGGAAGSGVPDTGHTSADDARPDDEPWGDEPRDDDCRDDEPRGDDPWDDEPRGDETWDDEPWSGANDIGNGAPGGQRPGGDGNSGGCGGDVNGGGLGEHGDSGGPGGPGPIPDNGDAGDDGDAGPALAASTNLTIPLAHLQHLSGQAGHAHGLGPLDPALARDLAAAAARSPHSTWCITIVGPDGYAIGHGCARPARPARTKGGKAPPGGHAAWSFTPRDDPGPPGGYGTWTLTLPGGRDYTIDLGPVPVTDCDHRHESPGYQPSHTLRHLVQVRDSQCTFPPCSRHARESDFEHAVPHDKGGRTCACNAGARSRRCHRVKQSKGWTVTQPQPGWHQWTTPSGRTYTQGPMQYPA